MTLRMTIVLVLVVTTSAPVVAQSGGPYAITASTIDGGGATFSTGGSEKVGGTVGQPDTGHASGGTLVVNGGFWAPAAAPTATPSATGTFHPTGSATPLPSSTPTPTATGTVTTSATPPTTVATGTPTRTTTISPSPKSSPTPSPTASLTPTPTATPARGDADCDGQVTAADLPALVRNVIGGARATCGLDDVNDDSSVDHNDIAALIGALFEGAATLHPGSL